MKKNAPSKSSLQKDRDPKKTRITEDKAGKKQTITKTRIAPLSPFTGRKELSILKEHGAVQPNYFFEKEQAVIYGKTHLTAMVRDPQWIFVYWEITDDDRNEIRLKIGENQFLSAQKTLRLLDVTDIEFNGSNAHNITDQAINDSALNWYLMVPLSGRDYCVQIGYKTIEDAFFPLAVSNTVSIPRGTIAENSTTQPSEIARIIAASASGYVPTGSSEKAGQLPPSIQPGHPPFMVFPGASDSIPHIPGSMFFGSSDNHQ